MDLEELRNEIDTIDDAIIPLLLRRQALSRQVAQVKAETGKAVRDAQREQAIEEKITARCGEQHQAVSTVYQTILAVSREEQEQLLNSEKR